MTYNKSNKRRFLILILLAVLAVASLAIYNKTRSNISKTDGGTDSGQSVSVSDSLKSEIIETDHLTYEKPGGWAKLSKDLLTTQQAESGVGYTKSASSVITFTVKILNSTPANDAELKNSVLSAPKYLSGFELIANNSVKIGGQSGQKFTYRFGTDTKTKQELNAVVYKKKTYILLFSGQEADFDTRSDDYAKILSSIKFK